MSLPAPEVEASCFYRLCCRLPKNAIEFMWEAGTTVPEDLGLCTETRGIRSRWAATCSAFAIAVTAIAVIGGSCSAASGNSAVGSTWAEKLQEVTAADAAKTTNSRSSRWLLAAAVAEGLPDSCKCFPVEAARSQRAHLSS